MAALPLRRRRRLHRHAADREPARRLHRRARHARGRAAAARAGDELSARRSSSTRRGRAHARIRIFTPAVEVPFAGHPTLGSAFVLAGPLQLDEIALETGSGRRPGPARAGRRADRLRADGRSRSRRSSPTTTRRGCSRRSASSGRSCPSSCTTTGCRNVYVALLAEAEVAALEPDLTRARKAPRSDRRQLPRRVRLAAGRRGCSRPPAAWPRIRRRARRPARSRSTSRATGGSRSATRSRSRRASRSTARRSSTRGSTAAPSEIERVEVGGSAVVVARGEFQL